MEMTDFEKELLGSVKEMVEIHQGEKSPAREHLYSVEDVKLIREQTGLSQSKFADFINVKLKTLQSWEQKKRHPRGPAQTLLRMIAVKPSIVHDTLLQNHG